jgi:hypothetical protein
MFEPEARCHTWSSTVHGRGKRSEVVTNGVYVVEHLSTGKYIVGCSKTVSADVDKHITALKAERHACKAFNKLCHLDSDLRLLEFPTKTAKESKILETRIRKTTVPQYLILN